MPVYAKSSSSPTVANHSIFLHHSSVCHLQCLLMCNYIQSRVPGLCSFSLSSCQRWSKYRAYGFLQFTCSRPSAELSLVADIACRGTVKASVFSRQRNSPLLVHNFSNTSSSFLFLMSCWTDCRLPRVSIFLDFTEKINIVTTNKYGWHWTYQESILSTEAWEHWKLAVNPLLLAWQMLCLRWVESAILEMFGYWSWALLLWELVKWLLQWSQLFKLFY